MSYTSLTLPSNNFKAMKPEEALKTFLNKALTTKKTRLIGFISKQKTQHKFLNLIYHELETLLSDKYKIKKLPGEINELCWYLFEPPCNFGEVLADLKDCQVDESFLLVSQDGKYAIHGPETFIDSRTYYMI